MSVEKNNTVSAGDVLARVPTRRAPKQKILQEVYLELPSFLKQEGQKDHAIIAEITGTIEFGNDFKNKRKIRIIPDNEADQVCEYMVPKNIHLEVQDGDQD